VKSVLQATIQTAKRLHYRCWVAPRGYGKPCPRQTWDQQYRAGEWDHLNSLQELDHYSVIVGYIRHFFEQAEILDLGCGHGRLLDLLHRRWFKHYTGVDLSEQAISRARGLNVADVLFVVDDFEKWTPRGLVDVIVFNESLYHGHHPVAIVKRYLPALKQGGKIIVSMHDEGNSDIIWRKLNSALRCRHGVHLQTDCGQKWVVRIFDPTGGFTK
jgi:2-polyprenyl-3-methyl-5-hydroxy-6-metoxy-1,4-benzoquinol methylase